MCNLTGCTILQYGLPAGKLNLDSMQVIGGTSHVYLSMKGQRTRLISEIYSSHSHTSSPSPHSLSSPQSWFLSPQSLLGQISGDLGSCPSDTPLQRVAIMSLHEPTTERTNLVLGPCEGIGRLPPTTQLGYKLG